MKTSAYFAPHQMGVVCLSGAVKNHAWVKALCRRTLQGWMDEDVMKIDVHNVFNLVSRQALLDECSAHFPGLLHSALWCYGQHPTLWHPMRIISSVSSRVTH